MAIPAQRRTPSDRRQRVIDGAIEAIAVYGVEGLTHRRVAQVAGVSLRSTTYYFATLEDLLEEAMRELAGRDIAALRERFAGRSADEVPEVLAAYIVDSVTRDAPTAVVISELYVAALRREHLRELAAAWDQTWLDVLEPMIGKAAGVVTAALGGLATRALLYPDKRDVTEIADGIRGLLTLSER
jgi:TetR/AcrR family transcriptional regulator, regulator of biofilm formation and stress response